MKIEDPVIKNRFQGINRGSLEIDELMRDLGYKPGRFGGYEEVDYVHTFTPPPYAGIPTDTQNRMDPVKTRVYSPNGERLMFVREYSIEGLNREGSIYAEFKDRDGRRYYFMGTDSYDLQYQIDKNTEMHERTKSAEQIKRGKEQIREMEQGMGMMR